MSMKKGGVKEYDGIVYSTILAHALQFQQDGIEPTEFINNISTTQDPTARQAFQELKDGDLAGYLKTFENY